MGQVTVGGTQMPARVSTGDRVADADCYVRRLDY